MYIILVLLWKSWSRGNGIPGIMVHLDRFFMDIWWSGLGIYTCIGPSAPTASNHDSNLSERCATCGFAFLGYVQAKKQIAQRLCLVVCINWNISSSLNVGSSS